jgi:hypothetical protein
LVERLSPWGKARVEDILKASDVGTTSRLHVGP